MNADVLLLHDIVTHSPALYFFLSLEGVSTPNPSTNIVARWSLVVVRTTEGCFFPWRLVSRQNAILRFFLPSRRGVEMFARMIHRTCCLVAKLLRVLFTYERLFRRTQLSIAYPFSRIVRRRDLVESVSVAPERGGTRPDSFKNTPTG